jgi:phosphocarrier protein HPr
MPNREVAIGARIGLHGRPAALVVQTAAAQPVAVTIRKDGGRSADARSIMQVLALGAKGGDTVMLSADGDGADAALDTMAALLARDLDAETDER